MIQILNVEPKNYAYEARQLLVSLGELHEKSLTREELIKIIPEYDVLIVRLRHQIDEEIIAAGERLKVIVTATTGLDHINVDYARSHGVSVLSLRGETEFLRTIPATAEHTWALLLSLVRRIPEAFESVRRGEWDRDAFRGTTLSGKNLGIVGLGRIGSMVAKYGEAFGMCIHAWDPNLKESLLGVNNHNKFNSLLQVSDIISLHVHLDDTTRFLLGRKEMKQLPKGAILINTGRGDLVDSAALMDALKSKYLAGAALDVIQDERDLQSKIRWELIEYARANSNLLITPHIGGATIESMNMTEVFMANKLKSWMEENQFL